MLLPLFSAASRLVSFSFGQESVKTVVVDELPKPLVEESLTDYFMKIGTRVDDDEWASSFFDDVYQPADELQACFDALVEGWNQVGTQQGLLDEAWAPLFGDAHLPVDELQVAVDNVMNALAQIGSSPALTDEALGGFVSGMNDTREASAVLSAAPCCCHTVGQPAQSYEMV